MPEISRDYLAGLYLDEITLDVMPQEYIDACLEVKLRYDACAPRAGYNCVQDRRVKGGFYYRKAPKGQGVNALPPSKLERALARSQEQPEPKSGMSFLSKAAIAAGLTVGGLALTGAVVNAGRSSEPYQEPIRPRSAPAQSNVTATNIGVAGVGAATVGAAVMGLNKKPVPTEADQPQVGEMISPTESARLETLRTPDQEEGYKAQQFRNEALRGLSDAGYSTQKNAYEKALSKDLKKATVTPENIKKKIGSLEFEGEHEGFVRINDVKDNTADGVRSTKSAREQQSADLQKLYDKLKEHGAEDSIEFRGAVDKTFKTPLKPSANQYTLDLRDGKPPVQVGEMRFRKTQDQIQDAIAENLKNPQARSQPVEKAAKPPKKVVAPTVKPTDSSGTNAEGDRIASTVKLGRAIAGVAGSDGFVNQASVLGDKALKARLGDQDLATLINDGVDEGRIQKKAVGKNIHIRDLVTVPVNTLINEAKGITSVKNLEGDRQVTDLRQALAYKEGKATNDKEKAEVIELKAAIAGIQETKPVAKKPKGEPKLAVEGDGGIAKVRGESAKVKAAVEALKDAKPPTVPTTVPVAESQIAAERAADEGVKKAKKEAANQSKKGDLSGAAERATSRLTDKALELKRQKDKGEIKDNEFNDGVEALRKGSVVTRAIAEAIKPIADQYDDRILQASNDTERKSLEKKKATAIEDQTLETYRGLQIPDPVEIKQVTKEKAPESPKISPVPPTVTVKSVSESKASQAVAKQKDPISDPPVIGGVKTYKMTDLTSGWNDRENMASVQLGDRVTGDKGFNGKVKGGIVVDKLILSQRDSNAVREFRIKHGEDNVITSIHHGGFAIKPEKLTISEAGEIALENSPATPIKTATRSRKKASERVSTAISSNDQAPPIDIKAVQNNIRSVETSIKKLEKSLSRMQAGGDPYQSAIEIMGTNTEELNKLGKEKLISKLQKAINHNKKEVKRLEQEEQKIADSLKSNNDAIAPSEAYLQGFHETRDKYRRAN